MNESKNRKLLQILGFYLIFGAFVLTANGQKLLTISDGRADDETPKLTKAEEDFIEKEVRRKKSQIRKENNSCEEDEFFSFSVSGAASGSFTRPKAAQKAYLYELCRSNIEFGIGGIIVVENGKTVAHYVYGENGLDDDIAVLPDINQNGLSEILLGGAWMGQGYLLRSVSILELNGRGVQYFGVARTYEDDSGTGKNNASTKAFKILVQKGKVPVYFRETYFQKEADEKWTLTKGRQKFSLDREVVPKYYKIS